MKSTYIITATGTDIGKTLCSAVLMRALCGTYWKPIQSGYDNGTDTERVRALTQLSDAHFLPEAALLKAPLSPHRAAFLEGKTLDPFAIKRPDCQFSPLIIEGAGGLLVPLTTQILQIDFLARFSAPLILCAATTLGTINHTLLSLEAIRSRSLPLLGVVFIGPSIEDTIEIICKVGRVKKLGQIPLLPKFSYMDLEQIFENSFQKAFFL